MMSGVQVLTRREYLTGTGLLIAAAAQRGWAQIPTRDMKAAGAFSWEGLKRQALQLSRQAYRKPPAPGAGIDAIDFDAATRIEYRADRTLWAERKDDTAVRFFPLNRYARAPVHIHVVENGQAREILFGKDLFLKADDLPPLAEGFAGFRFLNKEGAGDWLAFQGASYFRSAGALNQYGLSARGLAINTGTPVPEEFPDFTRFWLEHGPGDSIIVYALLESPSATGAYRFVNRRSSEGVTQEVTLSISLRKDVERLGIAPLTSMFWYGEGNRNQAIDWRPEIHDSDGLALLTGTGERIWRPLLNQPKATTNAFSDKGPKGFGLLQRDRNFDHYQDDGIFYERRPNLWVEPIGDWGAGAVMLYELPTDKEYEDNIVAYWTPAGPAKAGSHYDFAYRLHWTASEPQPYHTALVTDCWTGIAGRPGAPPIPGATRIVADFTGDRLAGLTRTSGVQPQISISHGKVLYAAAYPVVGQKNRFRMAADIAHGGETTDIRAYLRLGETALTETLLYQLH
jgi:glucans biosynthesis protein